MDDVDNLEGAALDRAVHLEVMGGSEDDLHRQVSTRSYVTREMAMDAGDLSLEGTLYSDDEWEHVAPPPYSSTWSGFGAVVDRIAELGDSSWGWTLWWEPEDASHHSVYEVPLSKRDDAYGEVGGFDPRVVFLRAALKAARAVRGRDEDFAAFMAAQAEKGTP